MNEKTVTISLLDDHTTRRSNWITTAQELYNIKQVRKELLKKEGELQASLKALSKDKNAKGGDFAFTCFLRKGSVEYAKVKELVGVDLEPYRKISVPMWKLTKV